MSIRSWADVWTELPLDGIEGEVDGDIDFIEYAGRSVTEAIASMLVALDYEVSAPMHAGMHGWELEIRAKGRRFWLQVTRIEDEVCHLIAFNMTWQFWRPEPFKTFLRQLDAALRADSRFGEIGWYKDWKDDTRTPHPVVGD